MTESRDEDVLSRAPFAIAVLSAPAPGAVAFSFANAAYEALLGRGALGGRTLEETRRPETAPLLEAVARAHEHGVAVHDVVAIDAGSRFADLAALPLRDASGHVTGVLTFAVDVTDHVQARREAEAATARFALLARVSAVLNESTDHVSGVRALAGELVPPLGDFSSVSLLTPDGAIERIADASVTRDDGPRVERARAQPVPEQMMSILEGIFRSGRARHFSDYGREVVDSLPPNDPYRLAVTEVGVRSAVFAPMVAGGRPVGYLTVGTIHSTRPYAAGDVDLVEVVAERAALAISHSLLLDREKKARSDAEAANRLKDQFLATMGHELRTPLNAILGWAQLLAEDGLEAEKRRGAVATIVRNARAQSRIVDDLLDTSRIAANKFVLDSRRLDVGAVLAAAVDALRPAANDKSLTITTDIPGGLETLGDAARLEQVFLNLVSNAVKFTPAGGHVRATLHRSDEADGSFDATWLSATIEDDGEGIPPEFLPRVFERFEQADGAVTRRHGGLGLGLAIARGIVELHGGIISAQSGGPGRGATFVVKLRLAPQA